ncbi:unnamed protein product [Linum trigynum]|uniref:Uncharacterized protein n=1 Tax=Linum trigynum TaxID=586398 RepID=A0AAV2DD04_9ROSI
MSLTPKNSFAILADADTLEIANHANKDHYLQKKKSGGGCGGDGKKKEQVSRWYENYKQRQEEEQASKQKQQPEKSNFVVLGHGSNAGNRNNGKGAVEKSPSAVKNSQQGKASTSNASGNNGQKIMAQGTDSKANNSSRPNKEGYLSKQQRKAGEDYGKASKNENGVVEKEEIERPTFKFDDFAQFPGLGRTH